jgi:hypothetical protein
MQQSLFLGTSRLSRVRVICDCCAGRNIKCFELHSIVFPNLISNVRALLLLHHFLLPFRIGVETRRLEVLLMRAIRGDKASLGGS